MPRRLLCHGLYGRFSDGGLTHKKVIHLFLHLMLHHLFGTVADASGYHDAAATLITCRLW